MKAFLKHLGHYEDILAIPLFALLTIYFYNIEHKTPIEYLLLFFGMVGFIADIVNTYIYVMYGK
jgi:hypothetical protein